MLRSGAGMRTTTYLLVIIGRFRMPAMCAMEPKRLQAQDKRQPSATSCNSYDRLMRKKQDERAQCDERESAGHHSRRFSRTEKPGPCQRSTGCAADGGNASCGSPHADACPPVAAALCSARQGWSYFRPLMQNDLRRIGQVIQIHLAHGRGKLVILDHHVEFVIAHPACNVEIG